MLASANASNEHVRLDLDRREGPAVLSDDDELPTSPTPLFAPDPNARVTFPTDSKQERERYEKKRKTLLLSAGVSAVGTAAVIATLATAIKSSTSETVSTSASDSETSSATASVSQATPSPTLLPPESADDNSGVVEEEATPSPSTSTAPSVAGGGSGSAAAAEAIAAGASSAASANASNGTITSSSPLAPGTCGLDRAMDPHLLYVTCPFAGNANAGFAMDKPCLAGETCVYACEPPYVCTENGFSDTDCVPYLGRCDPYSASTYSGGLWCNADGSVARAFPNKPLCAPGLNISFVTSAVSGIISSCQTVYPGNEAPMIGLELRRGETKQLTSFLQWYWHGTHSHFYVGLARQHAGRDTVCQWNYDLLSLNSGGVDAMPYVVGGGALAGRACSECGQHNLDFGENFDFRKAYSALPTYGVRVRNCNDVTCGDIQCDATYRFDAAAGVLESYWAVYNTIYGDDTVGCVADVVRGDSWTGAACDTDKFTRFEFYPIDITTGKQAADCATCSAPSMFDASRCKKLRASAPARFGTGANSALFVCTPTGGALALESKLVTLAASTTSKAEGGNETRTVTSSSVMAVQVVAVFALCAVGTLLVVFTVRLARQRIVGLLERDNEDGIQTPKDAYPDPFASEPQRSAGKLMHRDADLMDELRAATPIRRTSAMASASARGFAPLDE